MYTHIQTYVYIYRRRHTPMYTYTTDIHTNTQIPTDIHTQMYAYNVYRHGHIHMYIHTDAQNKRKHMYRYTPRSLLLFPNLSLSFLYLSFSSLSLLLCISTLSYVCMFNLDEYAQGAGFGELIHIYTDTCVYLQAHTYTCTYTDTD